MVGERFVGRPNFGFTRFQHARFDHHRRFGSNVVVVGGGYSYYPYDYPYSNYYGGYGYNYPNYSYPAYTYPSYSNYTYPQSYPSVPVTYSNYTYPAVVGAREVVNVGGCPATGTGDVVSNVQRILKSKGFYCGRIDGVNGPETRAAIRAYKAAAGLPPCGKIDASLLTSLRLM